jgi:glycosyltransferase involved in cell wall biosynthesis
MEVDDILIGLVARYHPQKDHHTFVQAAGQIAEKISNVRFVLCGHRIKADNHELITWIGETGFRDRFHLLGRRDDIPRITAGLDIATSSASHGEAFPNIIGEAMACGVPCVVTDVGDSAHIVGDTGVVVPPRAPQALAKAWSTLLSLDVKERCHLGESARERIREHFSLEKITSQYEQLYADLIYRS